MAAACARWLGASLPAPGHHRLYFDHGDLNLDALYAAHQRAVDALLAARGYRSGVDLLSLAFTNADHNEAAWRARLDTALSWLLPGAVPAAAPVTA
jgi:hypothetical protein